MISSTSPNDAGAPGVPATDTEAVPPDGSLLHVPPEQIRPNLENPRLHFPEEELAELAESIDERGILVPLAVYHEPQEGQPPYVLIDGERRWMCAKRLALPTVPAIMMPPPDSTQNLLTMFHIHLARRRWADMPTAWALEKVMERTGETDLSALSRMTHLSTEQIRRLLVALKQPEEYQELIDKERVPLNFFFELERNVLRPLADRRPSVFKKYGPERIIRAFLDKKLSDVTRDTVELRRMLPIINIAAQEAGAPDRSSDLDGAIEALIDEPTKTIQETYEETVEMVVEADKFSRQCHLLVQRFDRLMEKAETAEDRRLISNAVRELIDALGHRLAAPGVPA